MMFGMKVKGVAFREDLHTTPVTSVTIEELWGRRKSFQLIDVRTPDEFAAGTIPGAINFPLLSQTQHHQIGTLYRAFGQERAVAAGYDQLRHSWPEILESLQAIPASRPLLIFCARGGMRSRIIANIFAMLQYDNMVLEGGYKRFRNWNLTRLERLTFPAPLYVLHGLTGVGKTRILQKLKNSIDFEDLAQHRSSVFGDIGKKPVSTRTFEARLLEAWDSLIENLPIFLEGESRRIGNVTIPHLLFEKMKVGKRILLTASIETRVKRIARDYLPQTTEDHHQLIRKTIRLTHLLGKKQVEELVKWLEHKRYKKFFRFMLEEYYDKRYDNSMKGYTYQAIIDAEDERTAINQISKLF